MQEPGTGQPPPFEPTTEPTPEQKNWLLALHLSPLLMFTSIPFANVVAPLVIWLIKRDEIPLIRKHGPAVINFQISMCIIGLICALLILAVIGLALLPMLMIFNLVMVILGTIDAQNGRLREFPLSYPFIK